MEGEKLLALLKGPKMVVTMIVVPTLTKMRYCGDGKSKGKGFMQFSSFAHFLWGIFGVKDFFNFFFERYFFSLATLAKSYSS